MSSPSPSSLNGESDRLSAEYLAHEATVGHGADITGLHQMKQELDDTRPARFAFRPLDRGLNSQQEPVIHAYDPAPSFAGGELAKQPAYVSPFGRMRAQQSAATTASGPLRSSQQQLSLPFSKPAKQPTRAPPAALHTNADIYATPAPARDETGFTPISQTNFATQEDSALSQSRSFTNSVARTGSSGPLPATSTEDGDIVNLLWKKIKDRDIQITKKDGEIQELAERIAQTEKDKLAAMQQLDTVKVAAKDAVVTSAKHLEDFRAEMLLLKTRADDAFPAAADVRQSLSELQHMKETIHVILDELEPLLVPGETCLENQVLQTKAVVRELQVNLDAKQQVSDLLRDRVEYAMLELAEAKARVQELEGCQNERIAAEGRHAQQLRELAAQMAALAESLTIEKEKLGVATSTIDRLQGENKLLLQSVQEKDALLEQQDQREQELQNMKLELALLEAESARREARLDVLNSVQDDLAACHLRLHDAEASGDRTMRELQGKASECSALQEQISCLRMECQTVASRSVQLDELSRVKDKEISSLKQRLEDALTAQSDEGKKRVALEQEVRVVQSQRDGAIDQVATLRIQLREAEEKISLTRTEQMDAAVALRLATEKNAAIDHLESEARAHKADVDEARLAHSLLQAEKERLLVDLANLQQHAQDMQRQYTNASERLSVSVSQAQTLQERLDEQTTNVRAAKEDVAGLHEKLAQQDAERLVQATLASGVRADADKLARQHSLDLNALAEARQCLEAARLDSQAKASICEDLRTKLAAVRQQRDSLQLSSTQAELALEAARIEARGTEALFAQRLKNKEDEAALRTQVWEAQKVLLEETVRFGQKTIEELEYRLSQLKEGTTVATQQDASKDKQLLEDLANERLRSSELEQEVTCLKKAASTFASRYYDQGLLSAEEKEVVSRIARDTRQIYEQQAVGKLNELKKRENTINELQARNQLLEEQIAKLLQAKAQVPLPAASLVRFATGENPSQNVQNVATVKQAATPPSPDIPLQLTRPARARATGGQTTAAPRFAELAGPSSEPLTALSSSSSEYSPEKNPRKRAAPVQSASTKGGDTQPAKRARPNTHEVPGKQTLLPEQSRKTKVTTTTATTSTAPKVRGA
ncbi:hypothetical protein EXIGLDRAFT_830600 [Exidia glandulosa HHB12029]|uniref:Uncharacterized protein n=1 Tax=Exidia glandulosa HHB12029 TaxID=1314781 RepID=A0A165NGH5_EXIGL|nr:hypothetical protein EXIGLDRAFT_830600 [Exidia glandulosa HHB12029]